MIIDQSIERVRAFARQERISKSRLASMAGMRDTTLRGFWDAGWNPRVHTLRRLEAIVPVDFVAPIYPTKEAAA